MTLSFSYRPGPRERHLRRKHRSPLFEDSGSVTRQTLIEARHLDLADAEAALSLFEPAQLELLCAEALRRVEGLPPGSPRLGDARARLALILRHLATRATLRLH